jgi:hypothetical protein
VPDREDHGRVGVDRYEPLCRFQHGEHPEGPVVDRQRVVDPDLELLGEGRSDERSAPER